MALPPEHGAAGVVCAVQVLPPSVLSAQAELMPLAQEWELTRIWLKLVGSASMAYESLKFWPLRVVVTSVVQPAGWVHVEPPSVETQNPGEFPRTPSTQ